MANYYDILGVARNASEKEIRQAFRKLARQYHPDVNPGDAAAEEKFKEINEAYSVLSDAESRPKYDRYGDNWKHAEQFEQSPAASGGVRFHWSDGGAGGGPRDFSRVWDSGTRWDAAGRGGASGFGGLFDDLVGGINSGFRPAPAEIPAEVTLEEAFHGATRRLNSQHGRRLEVKIPPGVDTGSRIHLAPGGEQDADLYVVVTVQPHARYRRQGRDLHTEVDLPLVDAVLGGELSVPTLSGAVALTVPPNTPNERRFRLSGQGMPALSGGGGRGDLYATVKVKLPEAFDEEGLAYFRKLRETDAPSGATAA